jgi:hypothetical protein
MSSAIDRYNQEKKLAGVTTRALRSGLRYAIDRTTYKKSGLALNQAGSRAVFKDQRLQRVTLKAPHYIFKQHYGFEGNKKNGIMMRLNPTDVLNKAIEQANVLEKLADGIAEIRMDQVTARINFK